MDSQTWGAMEILTIIAIFVGPVVAVQLSQLLERRRMKYAGKESVFKTLMQTRASQLDPKRIQALNMIDVEFHGKGRGDRKVVAAWKLYLDNLGDVQTPEDIRLAKRNDLFLDLLYTMADALGYDFDKEHIKNTSYTPQAFVNMEADQTLIRERLISVLKDNAVSVKISDETKE